MSQKLLQYTLNILEKIIIIIYLFSENGHAAHPIRTVNCFQP